LLIFVFVSACGMPDTRPPPEKLAIPRMTKVRIRYVSPGVDPGSLAGQPVTFYRFGNQYGRAEFTNGDVALIREPHSFYIDASAKKAYHGLDKGPTYVFRTPVVNPANVGSEFPEELLGLEFGLEPEFLAAHGATERASTLQDGMEVLDKHVAFGEYSLIVTRRRDTGTPLRLGIFNQGKLEIAVQYEEWRRDLLPLGSLFSIPDDIEVVEGKPPFAPDESSAPEATPAPAEDAPAPEEEAPAAD
jgi:hypothetical protein